MFSLATFVSCSLISSFSGLSCSSLTDEQVDIPKSSVDVLAEPPQISWQYASILLSTALLQTADHLYNPLSRFFSEFWTYWQPSDIHPLSNPFQPFDYVYNLDIPPCPWLLHFYLGWIFHLNQNLLAISLQYSSWLFPTKRLCPSPTLFLRPICLLYALTYVKIMSVFSSVHFQRSDFFDAILEYCFPDQHACATRSSQLGYSFHTGTNLVTTFTWYRYGMWSAFIPERNFRTGTRTGVNSYRCDWYLCGISYRYHVNKYRATSGNRSELVPVWLVPVRHFVPVSCKQIQSHKWEPGWTRTGMKVIPVSCKHPLIINYYFKRTA